MNYIAGKKACISIRSPGVLTPSWVILFAFLSFFFFLFFFFLIFALLFFFIYLFIYFFFSLYFFSDICTFILFYLSVHLFYFLRCTNMSLREKFPSTELFLVRIFLYSDWIRENTDQKKLCIWTLFTQCV